MPVTLKLQAAIDACSQDKPTMTAFIGRLQHLGIDVRPYISDRGRKRISYELEGIACRGSKLHNGSFPKLIEERGIDFKSDRDERAMEAAYRGDFVKSEEFENIDWSSIDLDDYLPEISESTLPSAEQRYYFDFAEEMEEIEESRVQRSR